MEIGVINHDNCVIHVAEMLFHPGLNIIDSSIADRVLSDRHFRELVESGRLEVLRVRGKIRASGKEGDGRNFAMEELGERARELRRHALSEQPDQLKAHYLLLLSQGGMTESEVLRYIAQYYGLEVEDVARRLYHELEYEYEPE